jgi:signal transduction histidine kinase
MQLIFFVYGLAFIILAITVFTAPKRKDFLGIAEDIWLIGIFGLLHGLNEWAEIFILRGQPFNIEVLKLISAALSPLSFLCLVAFGAAVIAKYTRLRAFRYLYGAIAVLWLTASVLSGSTFYSCIFSRYLICVPGTAVTAAGLVLALRKNSGRNIPQTISFCTVLAALAFIAYGLFSGLITPRAPFFPASILNYDNFLTVTGIPAQFARMFCALTLAFSFLGISGILSKEKGVVKADIKRKLIVIIVSSVFSVILLGTILIYMFSYRILHEVVGNQNVRMSQMFADHVIANINGEVEDAGTYVLRPLWVDVVKNSNLKYAKMSGKEIEARLLDMDKKWISAKNDDPLLWEYLRSRVAVSMQDIIKLRATVAELFITDKYGGLVAASSRTSDFYQADEEWWQHCYDSGRGRIHVGNIEFDDSSKKWVIPIAVPMRDENGSIIGACKYNVDIERLFGSIEIFGLGKTGRAYVTDLKGNIIYGRGVPPMKLKYLNEDGMRALLSKNNNFFSSERGIIRPESAFFAYSVMKPPHLSDMGIFWIVFLVQDQAEVLDPLYRLISGITLIALALIAISIPVSAFFGSRISGPIHDLSVATERIMSGDWNYGININTGDEIEAFANTFTMMVESIRDKQVKLEEFSRGLEDKVRERTKELTETQQATLNILEDLEEAKANLEKTNKELRQLDELKSDFISTVSHELRTPLSIIKEGVSLVLDKVPGEINEKQFKILDISKFNIDRLARIIDSLLDIAKIEAGKIELRRGLIDPCAVVKQVADSFETKVKEKGLKFRLDIDKDCGKVYADPDRIAQVLMNLLGNAVKFTVSGGIEVSCKDRGITIACSVKDTGPGISKGDIPKLFDKFQQFGRLAGSGEKGTGLGLSIAKGIIDMHDGSISVESEPGAGSCFTFTLHKYTEQSLFARFAARAIKHAAQSGSKASFIAVSAVWKGDNADAASLKNFYNTMGDCARMIKNTLRREGDEVVANNADMLVILADCNKEHSLLVRRRLEQILSRLFEDKKMKGSVYTQYGCATFPDDGRTETELINMALAGFCSAPAIKAQGGHHEQEKDTCS